MNENIKIELKKLAQNIKVARLRRDMSLTELSKRSGVSRASLTRIEKAEDNVGIGKVFSVLSVLGLLDGITKILDPHLDYSQAKKEIEQLRGKAEKNIASPKISDSELDF